jgi:transcriptional regulator with XRE-family HTH domain
VTHRTIDASHDPVVNEMYDKLRSKLRRIRENADITQRTIALEIGMNVEMFCRLDNGACPADGHHFAVWARSLGLRLAIADKTGCQPLSPIAPGATFLRHEYLRIGSDLRARRKASGKVLRETAEDLGCAMSHVSNMEKACTGKFVAIRTLIAWCLSLDCHIELARDEELHALVLRERQEIARVLNRGVLEGRDRYPKLSRAGSAGGEVLAPPAGSDSE